MEYVVVLESASEIQYSIRRLCPPFSTTRDAKFLTRSAIVHAAEPSSSTSCASCVCKARSKARRGALRSTKHVQARSNLIWISKKVSRYSHYLNLNSKAHLPALRNILLLLLQLLYLNLKLLNTIRIWFYVLWKRWRFEYRSNTTHYVLRWETIKLRTSNMLRIIHLKESLDSQIRLLLLRKASKVSISSLPYFYNLLWITTMVCHRTAA